MERAAKTGDKVSVHCVGKLDSGEVFYNSFSQAPIEFVIGDAAILPGLETGIIGMHIGEKKIVQITSENAYGPRLPELVTTIPKSELPLEQDPQVGELLELLLDDGSKIVAMITHIQEDELTIDANHPLAGRDLTFEISLEAIH